MTTAMVQADEIRWTPAPVPAPDFLTLSDEDLLVETLVEAEVYRALSQQGIHELRNLQRELDRLRVAHHQLLEDYRLRHAAIGVAA